MANQFVGGDLEVADPLRERTAGGLARGEGDVEPLRHRDQCLPVSLRVLLVEPRPDLCDRVREHLESVALRGQRAIRGGTLRRRLRRVDLAERLLARDAAKLCTEGALDLGQVSHERRPLFLEPRERLRAGDLPAAHRRKPRMPVGSPSAVSSSTA